MAAGVYLLYSRLSGFAQGRASRADFAGLFKVFAVAWPLGLLCMAFELGAVSAGALQALRKEKVELSFMFASGVRRLPAVLGAMLLTLLALLPAFILLVFPAVILLCGFCAAVPAAVAEGLGPVRALSRSWALSRGRRFSIFAGFLVVNLCVMAAAMVVQGGTMALTLFLAGPKGLVPGPAVALPMAVYQLLAGFLWTLPLVASAVAYQGLREEKEGGDPVLLAKVFE